MIFLYTYCSRSSKWNSCPPSHQSLQPVSTRQTSFMTETVCCFQHFDVHKWKAADPLLQVHKMNLKSRIMCKAVSSCPIAIQIGGVTSLLMNDSTISYGYVGGARNFILFRGLWNCFVNTLHYLKWCSWWRGIPHTLSMVRALTWASWEKSGLFQYLRIYIYMNE